MFDNISPFRCFYWFVDIPIFFISVTGHEEISCMQPARIILYNMAMTALNPTSIYPVDSISIFISITFKPDAMFVGLWKQSLNSVFLWF